MTNPTHPEVPADLAEEVAGAQVRLLYRNAFTGAVVNACTSSLLVWLQAQGSLSEAALPWLIAMLLISTARVLLAALYTRSTRAGDGSTLWRNAFVVGVGLSGAGWMATIFIFMPDGDPVHQFATALVLAGLAAGAVPILSAVLNAYYLFISLTLVPAAVFFFLAGDITSIIIGLLTLIMTIGLLQSARFLNQTLIETLVLSAERARLAAKLESANTEIGQHNAQLRSEIEERRIAQLESLKAKDAAEAANRAKGEFLANMSHEVRTPMNAIMGMAEIALETELSADQRHYLEVIDKSSRSLLGILNDILDSSRIDTGRLRLEIVPFEPRVVLEDIAAPMRHEAHTKGLALRVFIGDDVPRWLMGDPGRVRQVLWNLIGNAVKFTSQGEVVISLTGEPVGDERSRIRLSVQDSGIGIARHLHAGLFEPFSQTDTSTTREHGGGGLGLNITRKLVDMMGGRLWFESDEGKGSEFSFEIEFAIAAAPTDANVQREAPSESGDAQTGKHVLLVEDNPVNQDVLRTILKSADCHATVAENGMVAVARFRERRFDAILMDLHMPLLDGFDATRAIREIEAKSGTRVPIIALTADAMPETKQRCLDAGMDDYLTKPVRRATLIAALRHWVSPETRGETP